MGELFRCDIRDIDLNKPLLRSNVGVLLATGDKLANRFGVNVYRQRDAVDLTGSAVTGYFIRPNTETVVIPGTVEGNKAFVDLPQACYTGDGSFSLAIKISNADVTMAVRVIDGCIRLTQTDELIDPGEAVPNLDDILAQIAAMETATENANTAASNAQSVADTLSDDVMKLNKTADFDDITESFDFGWTSGYIGADGIYRTSNNYKYSSTTLFLDKGDTVYVRTHGYLTSMTIIATVDDAIIPSVVSVDSNVHTYSYTADKRIGVRFTVAVEEYNVQVHRKDTDNPLRGKVVLNYGDSIAYGAGNDGKGYAAIIAEANSMQLIDRAVSGATFRTGVTGRSYISARIINDVTAAYKPDYILIEGGFNDVYNQTDGWLGELSEGYDVSGLAASNLYGALEKSFETVRRLYPEAKALYIITPKIKDSFYPVWDGVKADKFNVVRKAIIDCCEKWSVPYVDLFTQSAFNSALTQYIDYTSDGNGGTDGVHPTQEGYDLFFVPMIEANLKSI